MQNASKTITCGNRTINIQPSDEERFWKKVAKSDGCWTWNGAKVKDGYGKFIIDKIEVKSHRFSFSLENGDPNKDLVICHKCDNPPCVRPSHLFMGTRADNNKDSCLKGRRNGASVAGENNVHSKLKEADVRFIKSVFGTPMWKPAQIAARLGVTIATICKVGYGRTWKRVV